MKIKHFLYDNNRCGINLNFSELNLFHSSPWLFLTYLQKRAWATTENRLPQNTNISTLETSLKNACKHKFNAHPMFIIRKFHLSSVSPSYEFAAMSFTYSRLSYHLVNQIPRAVIDKTKNTFDTF